MPITEQDNKNQLKVIETSYQMYEDVKASTEKNMKTATNPDGTRKFNQEAIDGEMKLLNDAQRELLDKYRMFGGNPENLVKKKVAKKSKRTIQQMLDAPEVVFENKSNSIVKSKPAEQMEVDKIEAERNYLPPKSTETETQSYDIVSLPSKGECYPGKIAKVAVSYLTAYDEDKIIAPNLYRDNKILDLILQEKMINAQLDPLEMLEGDRDAIILFLRATGYGNEYPITARDPETGVEFESSVDLSKLKYKPFNLKGDERGWFDYTLPVCKKNIKFRFLTHNDILKLKRLEVIENNRLRKDELREIVSRLDEYVENDEAILNDDRVKYRKAIRDIENWEESLNEDDSQLYSHAVTNRMYLEIMAVEGQTDRTFISDFVRNMNVRDSASFRKYVSDNEPGIDFNIEVQRPESLGGGSFTVFLQLDQYIFLNIAV